MTLTHVKRLDKNSSGLSHLFGQGAVSAELLSQDKAFRDEVVKKLPHINHGLKGDLQKSFFKPEDWMVVYTILGVSDDPKEIAKRLPFFSRVNLRKHVQRVRSMQFKVALVGIPSE